MELFIVHQFSQQNSVKKKYTTEADLEGQQDFYRKAFQLLLTLYGK